MIEEQGLVLSITDGFAEVEIIRTSACNACRNRYGCGHHALSQLSGAKRLKVQAVNRLPLIVGQTVVIGIPEDTLLKASIWMYLVPIVGLMLGATLPALFSSNSLLSAITALGGFIGGLLYARKQAQKVAKLTDFLPKILSVKTTERSKIFTDQGI